VSIKTFIQDVYTEIVRLTQEESLSGGSRIVADDCNPS